MGAIVIRTRYDEGTESAEVATSGPSKSRDLADENNKILTEWKRFETTVFSFYWWVTSLMLLIMIRELIRLNPISQ